MSHVQQYGNLSYKDKDIGQYQGHHIVSVKIAKFIKKIATKVQSLYEIFLSGEFTFPGAEYQKYLVQAKKSVIDSRNVKYEYLKRKAENSKSNEDLHALNKEINHMAIADTIFSGLDSVFEINAKEKVGSINFSCLKASVAHYKSTCQWGEYDLKYVRNLALACNKSDAEAIKDILNQICKA